MKYAYDSWKICARRMKRKLVFCSEAQPNLRVANRVQGEITENILVVLNQYAAGAQASPHSEDECYWYHPDHLGSASWVSDKAGKGIQHLYYLPWGEELDNQRATDYASRYTFSGKERDMETGYGYFGARYYNSDLSIWLSVDPLSDKYPGVTPYVYCANNPVRLVDVDGREVYVTGTASDDYVAQLSTRRLIISRDETGRLSYAGKAKSRAEKQMVAAIDDKKIRVNICAENTNNIDGVPNCGLNGGAFLGCDYGYNSKEKKYVYTFQQVNPSELKKMGDDTGVGAGMFARHELTESYEGGKLSLDKKISSPMAGIQGSFYSEAHKKASFAYDLIKEKENTTIEFVIPTMQINISSYWSCGYIDDKGVIPTMQINISSYKYKIDPKYGLE